MGTHLDVVGTENRGDGVQAIADRGVPAARRHAQVDAHNGCGCPRVRCPEAHVLHACMHVCVCVCVCVCV
jgi:hypothetical protein